MTPIKYKYCNTVFAEAQPEYLPLPAWLSADTERRVVTCWKLSWRERLKILITGRLWFSQLTFGDPAQPLLPEVHCPLVKGKEHD
jgi:hypothetical protein